MHIAGIRPESGRGIYEALQRARDKFREIVVQELAKRRSQRDIQQSARESGPRSRCRPSDLATVRSATQFGQQAELSEISGQSNGTERTTDMTIVKQFNKETEAALQKAYGKPIIVFGLKPPVFDEKKSTKAVETKDPKKK